MENVVTEDELLSFFHGKRVFITGHTGFKGAWLWTILEQAGATLWGYALAPETTENLFTLCGFQERTNQTFGDIADLPLLKQSFEEFQPEIVIHLAAQPIVSIGYEDPVKTYETNVMGTVHILECCKHSTSVKSVLNVTTDKVYENKEWSWGYREPDLLDGFDPYANSKSCSELVTACYKRSFFPSLPVSTARAGNVIGGGDFALNRILPDCVKAALQQEEIQVRNPHSVRPYQHVLDALFAYLLIVKTQMQSFEKAGSYNIGPEESDCVTTGHIVSLFCDVWGNQQRWNTNAQELCLHESNFLKLDCSVAKNVLQWNPVWNIKTAVAMTCQWSKVWQKKENVLEEMKREILVFVDDKKEGVSL